MNLGVTRRVYNQEVPASDVVGPAKFQPNHIRFACKIAFKPVIFEGKLIFGRNIFE